MLGRLLKRIAAVGLAAAIGAWLALWLEHRAATELPAPTGPFAVARTSALWDGNLSAWIWHPAAPGAAPDHYLPEAIRQDWQQNRPRLINFLTRDLSNVRGHSVRDGMFPDQPSAYPVVILRGGAAGAALNYSSLAEDLASHGYVVVGLDMTTAANPEACAGDEACAAEMMRPIVAGIGRALDHLQRVSAEDPHFRGRLDLTRVGLFGHSFGGAQSAQFCSEDARCAAGIDIDGRPLGSVIETGIPVPFLFLLADHIAADDEVSRRILHHIDQIRGRHPDRTIVAAIRGAHHFTFSDDGALLKSRLFRGLLRVFGGLRIDGRRQVEVTAYAVRTFFDAHLKRLASPFLLTSPEFPELLSFRDWTVRSSAR